MVMGEVSSLLVLCFQYHAPISLGAPSSGQRGAVISVARGIKFIQVRLQIISKRIISLELKQDFFRSPVTR